MISPKRKAYKITYDCFWLLVKDEMVLRNEYMDKVARLAVKKMEAVAEKIRLEMGEVDVDEGYDPLGSPNLFGY